MKIAMLCASPPRGDENGWLGEAPVIPLSRALHRAGHEVHLFAPAPQAQSRYQLVDGLHHHRVAVKGMDYCPRAVAESVLYFLCATQEVAGRFDVVHGHDPVLLATLGQVYSRLRLNTVLSLWRDEHVESCHDNLRELEWRLEEIIGCVVCPARVLRDRAAALLGLPGQRLTVEYPGVDVSRYGRWVDQGKLKRQLGFGSFDPVVLCPGELDGQGGAWLLLEAAFSVRQRHRALRLVFVGDGPVFPYLRDRSRVLGFDGGAQFLRYIPESHLVELYNGCDVVYVATRQGAASAAVLEAWCAGKPTIVGDAAMPEYYEPGVTGLVAAPRASALTDVLSQVLDDREAAAAMGRAAWRKTNAELSWDAIAARMATLYQSAAPGAREWSARDSVVATG